ncbi:MAG: alpha-glucan family phosphorylase [Anaerolineae bacterium]|nr:alpha-glucan family phosphorylase [Anaerolineae bacterium]MCX8066376.1 alpha-glucan family phosphorylase [Anaerolineae bacterium]MDW7991383.1 alpha-glucan family phosphorylase [Anaerolineae bacterium]MDW8068684.1 alpha-glucan family phosphorylase [Anaerolineae bacterium]
MDETLNLIRAKIPPRIERLADLAYNLWWSWHQDARDLFKMFDYPLWRSTGHNPVRMLLEVSPERIQEVAKDPLFLRQYDAVVLAFDRDMKNGHLWGRDIWGEVGNRPIIYLSAEFGVHFSIPIYSGGLGILAGDHAKEASDLGLPLVGVGFLYSQGYFHQRVPSHGWQEAIYEPLRIQETPLLPVRDAEGQPVRIQVRLAGRTVHVALWHLQVGRSRICLMDTNLPENEPWDRMLSSRLYGGDRETRISQEIVLGIGSVRAVRALGLNPVVWHLNEGHCAFAVLERIRELVAQGWSFDQAAEAVRETTVFTTHTPVPAGHDVFSLQMVENYFRGYWEELGLSREEFLDLGRMNGLNGPEYNMTALALRFSGYRNGVSRLHGEITRRMWHVLWPDRSVEEVPVIHITNGVHLPSWVPGPLNRLFRKYLGHDWLERHDDPNLWERLDDIPDEELWAFHEDQKRKMMAFIRERARQRRISGEMDPDQVIVAGAFLDPEALTIGFARRFATYKRANLLFQDPERLKRILHNPYRPVQFIFAGKAHPADDAGKYLLQQVYTFAKDPEVGGRIAFIEDYDMHVARYLVQGVDVWLNTPRRPMEASGTSGQKAAMNGVPNLSVLDGWWDEGYNGVNGWAIAPLEDADPATQDAHDAAELYRLIEEEVAPLFYQRDPDGIPRGWVRVMREAIRSVAPYFCTRRMVKEYTQRCYLPAARAAQKLGI